MPPPSGDAPFRGLAVVPKRIESLSFRTGSRSASRSPLETRRIDRNLDRSGTGTGTDLSKWPPRAPRAALVLPTGDGQPGLRHVPQVDPAGDRRGPVHRRVVQYRTDEASVLLGDLLGEA